VDVISQDIYRTPEYQGDDPVAAFEHSVSGYPHGLEWMAQFAAVHGKPVAISEWGVPVGTKPDGEVAAWVDAFTDWIEEQNSDGDPGVAYTNYWNTAPSDYPQFGCTRSAPSIMSMRRDQPRHITMLPGGRSCDRAR
jgi:hypothetical protein